MAIPAKPSVAVWRKHATAYFFAIVISGLTLEARVTLAPWTGNRLSMVLFMLPIIFSAYVGGLGPGLLATALVTGGVYFLDFSHEHLLWFEYSVDLWEWALLIVNGALISIVVEGLHRSRRRVEAAGRLTSVTLASIGDAVITTDSRGSVTFLNVEAERLTGWSTSEAAGQMLGAVFRIINEQTRSLVEDPVAKVLQTGAVVGLANHTVLLSRDGRETPIDDSAAPIKEHDGGIVGVVLVFRDCSEKAKAQARLSESVSLLRTTIEASNDGLLVVDTNRRVTVYNQRFLEIWKIPPEVAAAGDDRAVLELGMEQVKDPGEIARVLQVYDRPEQSDSDIILFKDGRVLERFSCPQRLGGKIIGRVWSFRDVTERKRAEQAVRDNEGLLRLVIDLVPHFIFAKDGHNQHLFVNRSFAEAHGATSAEMVGGSVEEFVEDKEQAAAFIRDDREVIASGKPKFIPEERFTDHQGRTRLLEAVKMPFIMPGSNERGVLGVAVDITERKQAEAERSKLAAIVESSDDAIISKALNGVITSWNRSAERIFGYTAAEAIGQLLPQMFPPDRQDEEKNLFARVALGETFKNLETLRICKDGRLVNVSATISPLKDSRGRVIGVSKIVRDITEMKRADEAFAREQARFKLIFDTVPIGIAMHTVHPDGRCSRIINDAHLRICGISREQDNDTSVYRRITHPDDHALQDHFSAQVRDGTRKEFSMEKRYLHPDGKTVWANFSYQREVYADGTIEELTAVVDITERKVVEQQLMQLAVIVESSEDAIISKNLEGIITSWNRGAVNLFGYSAAEAIGQPMLNLLPPDQKNDEADLLLRIARGESIEHFQTERVRKDGRHIRISATISPVRDVQGNVVGSATIARDVTRQVQLEEQLRQSQKMEAIGQLAGGVAHDFNNILAVIQMQIELARLEGSFSPTQTGSLDEIQTAASRGANLTRQLLLYSRRQRLQPRELDLSDSITGMTKMLRRILGEDIQIQFKYAPQPLFILADPGMMDQVLMNLTLNSRDAMPDGGRLVIETAAVDIDELAASQSVQARPGSFVRLTVGDTGCGIPPEVVPRIFEPFFTTKDVGKGTGLGLATVFSIVEQHHGWISVYSELGRGTTFHIYLPRLEKSSVSHQDAAPTLASAHGGSETILLVEDDDALRASVFKCLSQLGYRLWEASSAIAALELWRQHGPEIHLLFTDLIMPGGMTGKELGERLLREKPDLKVVYVSGYSADIFTQDSPMSGGAVFLPKPFAAQALAQTVRACLDKK